MSSQGTTEAANDLARASDAVRELGALVELDDLSKRHRPQKLSRHSDSTARAHLPRSMLIDGGMEVGGDFQALVYPGGSPLIVTESCVIIREFPGSSNE